MDQSFISRTDLFLSDLSRLHFSFEGVIYNPMVYARRLWNSYQEKALSGRNDVLFLGMNPGPDGMVQTGVPFGARSLVRDYLKIEGGPDRPETEHPKRRITGLDGKKDEGSGKAFWGMVESLYPDVMDFFSFATVQNFCPLCFITTGDRCVNVTPDRLRKNERKELERLCLGYLEWIIEHFGVKKAVGIGKYAYSFLEKIPSLEKTVRIVHPSPINPSAHRLWADNGRLVAQYLKEEGIL